MSESLQLIVFRYRIGSHQESGVYPCPHWSLQMAEHLPALLPPCEQRETGSKRCSTSDGAAAAVQYNTLQYSAVPYRTSTFQAAIDGASQMVQQLVALVQTLALCF